MNEAIVKAERYGIEHVLPVAFLPSSILGEVDPECWVPGGNNLRDLSLGRPPVADNAHADGLRRVRRKADAAATGKSYRRADQPVKIIQPRHRMTVRLFDDKGLRFESLDPMAKLPPSFGKPALWWQATQGEDAALSQPPPRENGEAEFAKAGVEGKCGLTSFHHGV